MKDILSILEGSFQFKLLRYELLNSTAHGECFRFITTNGHCLFGKSLMGLMAEDQLIKEVDALQFIQSKTTIRTPKIYGVQRISDSRAILILEYIDRKSPSSEDMETFGIQLADMHLVQKNTFGWHSNNYISILNQANSWMNDWSEFYLTQRIEPLIKVGIDNAIFDFSIANYLHGFARRVEQEIPEEKASLIHGDLWGGNYIISQDGHPVLIDPAIYFGHREMDLAMSLLFGSFGRPFYEAYQNLYPLEPGFERRIEIHQIYPLLVHAILFQGDYVNRCIHILKR